MSKGGGYHFPSVLFDYLGLNTANNVEHFDYTVAQNFQVFYVPLFLYRRVYWKESFFFFL